MVNMSLMHDLSKVGVGRPTSASLMPVNASASEQLAELASPLDVQEIPTDKVARGTFVERTRGTSEVPSKHLVEELIGRRKKTKVSSQHRSHREGDDQDKSKSRAAKGKEPTSPTEETPTTRARPRSMKELCDVRLGKDGRDYHAIRVSEQLERAFDAPLEVDLTQLAHGGQVWLDGEPSATYVRNHHYYMALMDQVHDAGQVITSMDKSEILREEIQKLKDGGNPDAGQLVDARELLVDFEGQLRNVGTQVRQMKDELLKLTRATDALRVDLPNQAIEEYKKSPEFETGLVRMGRVSLEYGY
ncbi:hypothetical protein B296_00005043 [Ensete ventricosum]|uniref:Uncharacterized protein n=1 Tax=Ensete ventricosum TaxID=4639 RepID=A0A427BA50_ENSVE|nr:hypothetical protein B296_00005043 [Ensete ventricosum]